MNVRLRNRKAAETQLSSFITQIVVPPELISQILRLRQCPRKTR